MAQKIVVKFLGGVISHTLLAIVHSGNLQNDGKVTAGANGNGDGRHVDAKNIDGFFVHTKAVIHFALHPVFKLNDEVDFFGFLNRTHTKQAAYVHNANAAQLYIVLDELGSRADQGFVRYAFDFYGIVGNKSVTSFDQFNGGFTLTNTAISQQKNTFAVNFNKTAVACDARGEVVVQRGNQTCHNFACFQLCAQNRHADFFCTFDSGGIYGQVCGVNDGNGLGIHQLLQHYALCAGLKRIQILRLRLADELNAFGFEYLIKSRKRKPRAVDLGRGNLNVFKTLGLYNRFQAEILSNFGKRNGVDFTHWVSLLSKKGIFLLLYHKINKKEMLFSKFGHFFIHIHKKDINI